MAFNITVQSLLSSALYDTYSVETTTTVGTLTTTIQSATGVDPTWYVLNYNNILLTNSSATLGSYGITDTVALRSGNKIGRLTTLEDRQKAKLDLAALDRTASGNPRDTYDITQLPTQYSGNVVVDNPNPGGLIEGRPWV